MKAKDDKIIRLSDHSHQMGAALDRLRGEVYHAITRCGSAFSVYSVNFRFMLYHSLAFLAGGISNSKVTRSRNDVTSERISFARCVETEKESN